MEVIKTKRMKHDYTSETELKSLIIREKNKKINPDLDESLNSEINNLLKEYQKTKDSNLKEKIFKLSEITSIDEESHRRFGEIILLMIKKILTKPNFSGYSWQDDFYSDSCYRVFKYLHNFDYKKTSTINNQPVSAFAYISQIIHNSILFIIQSKKKINEETEKLIRNYSDEYGLVQESENCSKIKEKQLREKTVEVIIENTLIEELKKINLDKKIILNIIYPKHYRISYDEYSEIQEYFKNSKSLVNLKKSKNI